MDSTDTAPESNPNEPTTDQTASDSTDTKPKSDRKALLTVFLVIFIDLLGFGIVIPMLSLDGRVYIERLLPANSSSVYTGIILGLLMSCFSAMQFIFAPLWGRTSDKIGRRPVLLIGLLGSVVFYSLFGCALVQQFWTAQLALILLFVARSGAGIAGATIPTAQAVIADSTPPEGRKHGMAIIGAAFGMGFTLGPALGALAIRTFPNNPEMIGYAAATLSFVAMLLCWCLFKETRKVGGPQAKRKWFSISDTREVLKTPTVGLLVGLFFLTTVGFSSFEPTLALLNQEILGLDKQDNYLIFFYVGFVLLITQGYIYRKAAKNLSEETLMTIGMLLMGLGLATLGTVVFLRESNTLGPMLIPSAMATLTVSVMGFAFLTPSIQALISRRSDADRQGEVMGVNQSASAMARILGPIIGLVLYFAHSSRLLPYAFGAVVLLSMLTFIPRIQGDKVTR